MALTDLFAVLPYLPTSQPIAVRGITFRSSTDLDGLPKAATRHVNTIFAMFRLANGDQLDQMSYAHLPVSGNLSNDTGHWRRLQQAHTLIGYLYTAMSTSRERHRFHEFADMYVFLPDTRWPFPPDTRPSFLHEPAQGLQNPSVPVSLEIFRSKGPRRGYTGWLNFTTEFRVNKGSRIYAPLVYFHGLGDHKLGNPDLSHDLEYRFSEEQTWALADLVRSSHDVLNPFEERLLTALRWHNRSAVANIEDELALVYLAIAFECLFDLPQDRGMTQRFSDTLRTLLGPIPRL